MACTAEAAPLLGGSPVVEAPPRAVGRGLARYDVSLFTGQVLLTYHRPSSLHQTHPRIEASDFTSSGQHGPWLSIDGRVLQGQRRRLGDLQHRPRTAPPRHVRAAVRRTARYRPGEAVDHGDRRCRPAIEPTLVDPLVVGVSGWLEMINNSPRSAPAASYATSKHTHGALQLTELHRRVCQARESK
jgi:hypothetical protein